MKADADFAQDPEALVYPRPTGRRYLQVLRWLHAHRHPTWYLEVGTHFGKSLEIATCSSIAVDPNFAVRRPILGDKPNLHCLAMTSDDFFASGFTSAINAKVDLAFLDGMHLFEFVLRDFMNTEALMTTNGTIVLHDVIPIGFHATRRTWDKTQTNAWTGDVWKIIPALRKFRPDLQIDVLDAKPSGLAVISNLDPASTALQDQYDDILAEFIEFDVTPASLETIVETLAIQDTAAFIADAERAQTDDLVFAVHVPAPKARSAEQWGEYHFADSLRAALDRAGAKTRIVFREDWDQDLTPGEMELLIRGKHSTPKRPANSKLIWVQSHAAGVSDEEAGSADHVFYATRNLDADHRHSSLLQCVDAARFAPGSTARGVKHPVLFVGNCYPQRRARGMVRWAIDAEVDLSIFGRKWHWVPDGNWRARNVPNEELGALYRSAGVVLNDHHHSMRGHAAYVNNRVYDVLACATPLVSDPVDGLPDGFEEFIYFADDPTSLAEAIDLALREDEAKRLRRFEFARHVQAEHSFDARARDIVAVGRRLRAAHQE
ncbi:MAG: glycosyltransferase [Pseudomonadota bacterium]